VPGIFISYRREDAPGHAGRLYDEMIRRFGEERVFMDLDMEPGVDFVEQINEAVGSCQVLIAVIGPRWISIDDAHGQRRIDDPGDFIRIEIEAALARRGVRVIPVLVQRARMPTTEEIPPSLADLARRNALELSDGRWSYDVGRLTSTVDRVLGTTAATSPTSAPAPPLSTTADPAPDSGRGEHAPPHGGGPPPARAPEAAGGTGWLRRHLGLAAALLAVVIAAVIGIVLATSSSQSSGQVHSDETGEGSPAGIRFSNLVATADHNPLQPGDQLQVAFSLKNVGSKSVTFAETFVGARDPSDNNADFSGDNHGFVLTPGKVLNVSTSGVLDARGTWEFWPCYTLRIGSPRQCPDEWGKFFVTVGG
jgi:TIR domain-containing protein